MGESFSKFRPNSAGANFDSIHGNAEAKKVFQMKEKPQLLSWKEKKIIKKVWSSISADNNSGENEFLTRVWLTAINRSSKMKSNIFEIPNESTEQDIRDNHRFKFIVSHANGFFDQLIKVHNLDTEQALVSMMELGMKHAHLKSIGFQAVYWDIFLVSLMEVLENWELENIKAGEKWFAICSWHKFVHLIVTQVSESYLAATLYDKE